MQSRPDLLDIPSSGYAVDQVAHLHQGGTRKPPRTRSACRRSWADRRARFPVLPMLLIALRIEGDMGPIGASGE